MTDDAAIFRFIAQGRLPRADALDGAGRPCWRLQTLLAWLNIDMADFLGVLPTRIEGRQHAEVVYEIPVTAESIPTD